MKLSPSERAGQVVIKTVMVLFLVGTLYPLVHVTFAALSEPEQLMGHRGPLLWPQGFSTTSFDMLFKNPFIVTGFLNSLFLILVGVAFNILMTAIAAYVLSKRQAALVKYFTVFIVFTMLFSGGLIPLYLTIQSLGLLDNLFSLILPFAISTFNLIILRTAFEGIPVSLEESALLDGAGHFTILFRISIPLVMPMIAVLILYYAVDRWNGWFYASVFLSNKDLFPLQLILRDILLSNETGAMASGTDSADLYMAAESIKYAGIVVGTLPVLVIYPFLQRYFVSGKLSGAVKE